MYNLQDSSIVMIILALSLSSLCVYIWGKFFYRFTPRFTTPQKFSRNAFVFGIIAMIVAFFIEGFIQNTLNINSLFFSLPVVGQVSYEILNHLVYAFLVVAFVEETVKFLILKNVLKNPMVDQAIDGVKIGLWLGLGFAFAENTIYFFNFFSNIYSYSLPVLALTLFVRGVLATLAHGIYGIIMGYYIALAKFHRLYRPRFLKLAYITSILVHGLFDFLLIVYLGPISVFLLVAFLAVALVWYSDRRSLELDIAINLATSMERPFLARQDELEIILSKQSATKEAFQKIMLWFRPKDY